MYSRNVVKINGIVVMKASYPMDMRYAIITYIILYIILNCTKI